MKPLFIVRYQGMRGPLRMRHSGPLKRDAVAAYDREVAKVKEGFVTLHRVENGVAELLARYETIPLPKAKKRRKRHPGVPPIDRNKLLRERPPGRARIVIGRVAVPAPPAVSVVAVPAEVTDAEGMPEPKDSAEEPTDP